MTRDQLVRQLKTLSRKRCVKHSVEKKRGKGSHITIYFGDRKAVVPKGELKKGTLHAIFKQLNLKQDDLSNPKP